MRFVKVTIVSLVLGGLTYSQPVLAANYGERCSDDSQCPVTAGRTRGYCYPGPNNQNFCLHGDLKCAKPGAPGAEWGEMYFYGSTVNFCRNRGDKYLNLQSNRLDKDDFKISFQRMHFEAKPGGGILYEALERTMRAGAEALQSTYGVPAEMTNAAADEFILNDLRGAPRTGEFSSRIQENFRYCQHDMRILGSIPETGEYRARYGITEHGDNGVTVYYNLPNRPLGQGRTVLDLEIWVFSVHKDKKRQYVQSGLCKS